MSDVVTPPAVPVVSKPPEVSLEEFGMLAVAQHGGITGLSPVLYWWVLHLGQTKPLPWFKLSTKLAVVLGVHRQHIFRMVKKLKNHGFVEFDGKSDDQTIRAIIPGQIEQGVMVTFDEVVQQAVPSRAPTPVTTKKTRVTKPSAPASDPTPPEGSDEDLTKHGAGEAAGETTKSAKPKTARLTSDHLTAICASYEAMLDYLLYGLPGLTEPDEAKKALLPPTDLNWRQFRKAGDNTVSEEACGLKQWKATHFIGFYWMQVCYWRKHRNVQLTLPNYGRLGRNIKMLMGQMSPWQLYTYIMTLAVHFDLFCCMVGSIAENMLLDEMAISHSVIRNAVLQFLNVGKDVQDSYYEQFREQITVRQQRYSK